MTVEMAYELGDRRTEWNRGRLRFIERGCLLMVSVEASLTAAQAISREWVVRLHTLSDAISGQPYKQVFMD